MYVLEQVPAINDRADLDKLRTRISDVYRRLDDGEIAAEAIGYVPIASSFPLWTLGSIAPVLRLLNDDLIQRIAGLLGPGASVDVDISWVRRQFPPSSRPASARPHSWHQDGAWGFDFLKKDAIASILPMVTLWIALDDCGNEAPGLEFVRTQPSELLPLGALDAADVARRYDPSEYWRPSLKAGEALLFSGEYLHRTHVVETMTAERCSIELRLVDGFQVPLRLAGHRFLRLR